MSRIFVGMTFTKLLLFGSSWNVLLLFLVPPAPRWWSIGQQRYWDTFSSSLDFFNSLYYFMLLLVWVIHCSGCLCSVGHCMRGVEALVYVLLFSWSVVSVQPGKGMVDCSYFRMDSFWWIFCLSFHLSLIIYFFTWVLVSFYRFLSIGLFQDSSQFQNSVDILYVLIWMCFRHFEMFSVTVKYMPRSKTVGGNVTYPSSACQSSLYPCSVPCKYQYMCSKSQSQYTASFPKSCLSNCTMSLRMER